jgi:1,4-dihydroxy-2-naphthoate octaprenyltransferase
MERIALDRPPSTAEAWLLAIRPKTLPAAVAGVVVGCAVAAREGGFAPPIALAALAVALLLQIAANLANDVYDFQRGADTNARVGPVRVTHAGLLSPRQVMGATALTIAAAIAVGLYLVAQGGWPIFLLGLLAVVSAVAYTAGPAPLGYLGLGEAFVFLFFGFAAVAGTAYVQTRTLTPFALMASVPLGAIVSGVLVVNNLRDIDTDRAAGKRTLAVLWGPAGARREYAALLALAYLTPLVGWLVGLMPVWALLAWLSAPVAWSLTGRLWAASGPALNPLLGATARLAVLFAVPFAIGLLL